MAMVGRHRSCCCYCYSKQTKLLGASVARCRHVRRDRRTLSYSVHHLCVLFVHHLYVLFVHHLCVLFVHHLYVLFVHHLYVLFVHHLYVLFVHHLYVLFAHHLYVLFVYLFSLMLYLVGCC